MAKRRLDAILSHVGVCSRREAKTLAKLGQLTVNGEVVRDASCQVDVDRDVMMLNGRVVQYRRHIYLMLNKPSGVLSATEDARQRTVVDLLPPEWRHFSPFPVGRLDRDTEGLLLLTSDGELAHRLLSPRFHVAKRYIAWLDGSLPPEATDRFRAGIELKDGTRTLPAELRILRGEAPAVAEVVLYEGKYHQVKRMFSAVGRHVTALKRVAMGTLELDPLLQPGEWREIQPRELAGLRREAGLAGERS